MLVTSWLSLLTADRTNPACRDRTDRPADRREARQTARAAFRTNPFRPPTRVRSPRGCRLRPSELRWLIHRRQF